MNDEIDNNGNGEVVEPVAPDEQLEAKAPLTRETINTLIGELQAVKIEKDPTKAWAMLRETISQFRAQHLQD